MVSSSGGIGEPRGSLEPAQEEIGGDEVGHCHGDERSAIVTPSHQRRAEVGSEGRQSAGEHAGDADVGGAL